MPKSRKGGKKENGKTYVDITSFDKSASIEVEYAAN